MANRLRKVPSVTTRPGTPGVPSTPAYCTLEPVYASYNDYSAILRRVVSLTESEARQKIGSYYWGQIGTDKFGRPIYGTKQVTLDQGLSNLFTGIETSGLVLMGYNQICYPAVRGVPAIPPSTTYSSQTGWNSGGLSVGGFPANGYAQFVVAPDAIGIVVGINTGPDTNSPSDCSHAFYAANGSLSIFERGAVVQAVATNLAARPVLRIVRAGAQVSYFVDGVEVYQSPVSSVGYARIDAALYVAGDYVDDPAVGVVQRAAASTSVGVVSLIDRRPRGRANVGVITTARGRAGNEYRSAATTVVGVASTADGYAVNNVVALTAVGVVGVAQQARNTVRVSLPSINTLAADGGYAFVEATYAGGYEVESDGGFPEVQFSGVFALAPPPSACSFGPSGGIGDVTLVGPAADTVGADYAYAQVVSNYEGAYSVLALAPWLSADAIFIDEAVLVSTEFIPFVAIHANFSTVVEVGDSLTVDLEVIDGFEWLEPVLAAATFAELSDKTAEMVDVIYVTDQTMDGGAPSRQIATVTTTAAATNYNGFDFLSLHHMGRLGSYAVRPDGVYRVGDGLPVSALVDTGSSGFGSYAPKRLEAIYIGMRTDGDLIAVVRAEDETERTYRVIQRPDYMRVSTAKGDSSKEWRLRLELTEAQAGDVDIIQFVVSEQPRRWSR